MKIWQQIKQRFRKRTLYLVYYSFQEKANFENSGIGSTQFKIYPKINSYRTMDFIINNIKKGFDSPNSMKIVIKNIIKLD